MAVVWLVLGVVLLLVELSHLAFFALFAAAGCFAAAAVAAAAPSATAAQAGVAVMVAVAGVVAVRPVMSRAFHHRHEGSAARGVHGGLVGQQALALDQIGPPHHAGHVRLTGERWLAISGSGLPIPAGTPVVVTAVEGTTLTVWPAGDPMLPVEGAPPDGADGRVT